MRRRAAAFVAMSGVRIRNEKLLALGMTMPGFVERGKVIASLPSLGLLTLAGCLPPKWHAQYFEIDEIAPDSLKAILDSDAQIVAISSLTARIFDAYRVADDLRKAGKTVVIGGLHASAMPAEAMLHADAVVVGEGEQVWGNLIQDFESGHLKPIYDARMEASPAGCFGSGPLPRYDLLDINFYNRITLQTARGCPLDCAFCGASRLISPYRRKGISRIAEEVESILSIWPKPFLELADDNTFVHKRWSKELAKLLGSYGVRWFTESDISVADDEELLELLALSGCAQVLVGLESPSEESLKESDSKSWKRKKRQEYFQRIARIQSYGISVNGCLVVGFDHDGPEIFEQTLDFVRESGLSDVQVTILTPFPGTGLYAKLHREDRLLTPIFWDQCTLFDVAFKPKRMSVEELEQGFRWLAGELYRPAKSDKRKAHRRELARTAKRKRDDHGIQTSAA